MAATITADTDQLTPYLLGQAEILDRRPAVSFCWCCWQQPCPRLDSVLLVTASAITRDLQLLSDDDPRAIGLTPAWVVVISLAAMIVALNPFADIVEINRVLGVTLRACFLSTLVVGLYWNRPNATRPPPRWSPAACLSLPWWLAKRNGWTEFHEVYVGLVVSTLVYVTATLTLSPRNPHPEQTH